MVTEALCKNKMAEKINVKHEMIEVVCTFVIDFPIWCCFWEELNTFTTEYLFLKKYCWKSVFFSVN